MAEAARIRSVLATFLGKERYRKFVREGVRRGRLRHWQEQEWSRFTDVYPEFAVDLVELEVVLRICELHGQELLCSTFAVFSGYRKFTVQYIEARNRLFPHSSPDQIAIEGVPITDHSQLLDIWYCPVCREAKMEWQIRQQSQRG